LLTLFAVIACSAGLALTALTLHRMRGEPPWRAALVGILRAAALLALTVAVANPVSLRTTLVHVPQEVLLAVDDSASMALPHGEGGPSRLSAALDAGNKLVGLLAGLETPPTITWIEGAGGGNTLTHPAVLKPHRQQTDLRDTLRSAAAGYPEAHVVLLSDGADTTGARGEQIARAPTTAGLSVSAVGFGRTAPSPDINVQAISAPRRTRANSRFDFGATVLAHGYADRAIGADLLRDGRVIRQMTFAAGQVARGAKVSLSAPEPGRYRYTLRVTPRPGELSEANNSRSMLLQVVPDKLKVLLVAGAPSVEYAFLKRFLLGDADLKVRCAVRKAKPAVFWRDDDRHEKAGLSSLVRARGLNAMILLDVPGPALATVADSIASFVRAGGGLGVVAGSQSSTFGPLADLLPAQMGPAGYLDELVHPRPAGAGDALSRTLADIAIPLEGLRPWRGRRTLDTPRPDAATVLSAQSSPLLVTRRVGRGRALLLATDSTHRWAFGPSPTQAGKKAYADLWGVLVDWLTQLRDDRPVVAQLDREQYEQGAIARLVAQVTDGEAQPVNGATLVAKVSAADQQAHRVRCHPVADAPGRYEAMIPAQRTGSLSVQVEASRGGKRLGADKVEATVVPPLDELARGRANPALLRSLADEGNGTYVAGGQQAHLVRTINAEPARVQRSVCRPMVRRPWLWVIIIAVWALDWSLRRRWTL